MALYDIASMNAQLPLYQFLGGQNKHIESDLTIGIDTPEKMAATAKEFQQNGIHIIKVKLGKNVSEDIQRIQSIREAIGYQIKIRIDANQGWSFNDAIIALTELGNYQIEFCEQPMRKWNDELLPELMAISPIPIMADESVFTHHDAERLIRNNACTYINIKFAKSGGILEATKINQIAEANGIACMLGGMLESRVALTAKMHFALANKNIQFFDLDTCMVGHKVDPVIGGLSYKGMELSISESIGIGADVDPEFLKNLEQTVI
jgi:L-alanine-DL-glutamate epimerase-like enolase superfamily enzyme